MKKILIANRGEIALRIMRSAKEMGISTVAIFSEVDRNALHVRYADEAVCIGPSPSVQSYLLGDKIIDVSKKLNVDAIHPGYGFLSENAGFARKVQKAGLIFIGPSPESMDMMGDKLAAKQTALKSKVPMVPGIEKAITDVNEAKKIAAKIGFPVLIKASAGGGGKGMRVVKNETEFESQMQRAVSEAKAAFGNGSVFLEKLIASPRHIEIQILGDKHGNIVYLFERECSIQRRHQKLIEEAPSAILTPELRKKMGESAVALAKGCNYYNAGTLEFLVDKELNFYFLEMNTRLQVEHPVTELITGLDIVKEQIRIARGEKLSFTQQDIVIRGHAMELRVCAEDPANDFLPDTGTLTEYKIPQGPGVRVDGGFERGMAIPVFYDSMIAKLITYGKDRKEAIERMRRAIDEYEVTGIQTTLSFGKWIMEHPKFISAEIDTGFIGNYFKPELLSTRNYDYEEIAASIAAYSLENKTSKTVQSIATASNWLLRNQYDD